MIINTSDIRHIYLASSHVDMRKSIDGLALIVSMEFNLDVMDGSLFIFTNRTRNRIKMLYYDNNGFWLFFKRPESGKFKLPENPQRDTRVIDELEIDQKFAHRSVENRLII